MKSPHFIKKAQVKKPDHNKCGFIDGLYQNNRFQEGFRKQSLLRYACCRRLGWLVILGLVDFWILK